MAVPIEALTCWVEALASWAEALTSWVEALKWRSIGPTNMGGRITGFAVNPTDPSNFFVATGGGGVLRTTTNGITFDYQTDPYVTSDKLTPLAITGGAWSKPSRASSASRRRRRAGPSVSSPSRGRGSVVHRRPQIGST